MGYQKSLKVKFKPLMMVMHANIVIRNLPQNQELVCTFKQFIMKRSIHVNNVIIRQPEHLFFNFMFSLNMKALNTNVNNVIIGQPEQIVFNDISKPIIDKEILFLVYPLLFPL